MAIQITDDTMTQQTVDSHRSRRRIQATQPVFTASASAMVSVLTGVTRREWDLARVAA